ncbi:hypothetical protein [uncultured Tolumonas sp.]|uniref:hypothetical protein n=1 Tax=uncultured Tolumonas sp. TaxID=263765 RepID=UPI002A0A678C|nr:hypothetical protein [uncultured Tolumonas sp.]
MMVIKSNAQPYGDSAKLETALTQRTTRRDIDSDTCEHRIYKGHLRGGGLHIECPFCAIQAVLPAEYMLSHDVNCRCGALLTWWYAAYRKKSVSHGL